MLPASEANMNFQVGEAMGNSAPESNKQADGLSAHFHKLLRTMEHNMLPIHVRCKYQTMPTSALPFVGSEKKGDGGALPYRDDDRDDDSKMCTGPSCHDIKTDPLLGCSLSFSRSETDLVEALQRSSSLSSLTTATCASTEKNSQLVNEAWQLPATTPSPFPCDSSVEKNCEFTNEEWTSLAATSLPPPNDLTRSVPPAPVENGTSRGNMSHPQRKKQHQRFRPFHEEKWTQRLAELRLFREQHGHCLVPLSYPPNPKMARWVKRQRRQYKLLQEGKTSTMTPERAAILEEVGFVWDRRDCAWKEKIRDLQKYRVEHGNTNVPSKYQPNMALALWVKFQRRQYRLFKDGKPSATTRERIEQLEREGFLWEAPPSGSKGSSMSSAEFIAKLKGL